MNVLCCGCSVVYNFCAQSSKWNIEASLKSVDLPTPAPHYVNLIESIRTGWETQSRSKHSQSFLFLDYYQDQLRCAEGGLGRERIVTFHLAPWLGFPVRMMTVLHLLVFLCILIGIVDIDFLFLMVNRRGHIHNFSPLLLFYTQRVLLYMAYIRTKLWKSRWE